MLMGIECSCLLTEVLYVLNHSVYVMFFGRLTISKHIIF